MPQTKVNHPVAITTMAMGHVTNTLSQALVAVIPAFVAKHAPAHTYHPQRMPFRQPSRSSKPYQLAPCRYGYHFFLSASRATSFSSTDSANNFFSRAFSVSSSLSRFASGTDIPPNFDFHR